MSDQNTSAEIIFLQEKVKSLETAIEQLRAEIQASHATKAYVQTYVEQLVGDIMPVHDKWTGDSPIAGYIPLDISKALKHFANIKGTYNTVDFTNILMGYDEACMQSNINPYFAVAQMVKETDWTRSWWAQRPRRNPAGIGVTGETSVKEQDRNSWAYDIDKHIWKKGYSFPSWQISAQAHIGHLLTYMYKQEDLDEAQKYLVSTDPRSKYVPVKTRGTVIVLKDLNGKWAIPGVGYGQSIAVIANALNS